MKPSRIAAMLVALASLLAVPASAQAQITLGQLAPGQSPEGLCLGEGRDEWQDAVQSGAAYQVPRAGTIVSWSTNAAAAPRQLLTFKVIRPVDRGFLVVGHDGPQEVAPSRVNSFRTAIAVQPGDVLALNAENTNPPPACLFQTGFGSDRVGFTGPAASTADGMRLSQDPLHRPETGTRLNVQATLLEPPTLTAVGMAIGPVGGGTAVAIAGTNLAEVRGVTFGGVPADSFKVDSESQITAVAPPSAQLVAVPIVVTTIAGTATAPQPFTYVGCLTPKLKRKSLKAAKRLLREAVCGVGSVKRRRRKGAKPGTVVLQSPGPGQVLPPGAMVKLMVTPRSSRR